LGIFGAAYEDSTHVCVLFKAYTGEMAWNAIGDRLQSSSYLSRVDHNWKIRARKQTADVGKYSFVNRIITNWNQLPEWAIEALSGNTLNFRKRVRKVITNEAK
jgi:hypothetical protein